MDRTAYDRYIGPPPRVVPAAEALPNVGGLALAPYRGELPDETEPHAAEALEGAFTNDAAQTLLRKALAPQKVRERLARGRSAVIGISRRGEPDKGERRFHLVVAYDYANNVAIEITVDESGELVDMNDVQYQPPPTDTEIGRAIELARLDERLVSKVDGLVATTIPFSGVDNEFANRRVLEVLFGCRSERLPRYRAWVDLSAETVLHAGGPCACCDDREERP